MAIPLTFAYAFMGLSAWYPCRQLPLTRSRALPLVLTHAAAAGLISGTWVGLAALLAGAYGALPLVQGHPLFPGLTERFAAQAITLFAAGVLLYLLAAALNYVLLAVEAARRGGAARGGARGPRARGRARRAEGADPPALPLQQPELDRALTATRSAARRSEMCVLLAEFLRRSLALGEKTSDLRRRGAELSRGLPRRRGRSASARGSRSRRTLDERGNRCLRPAAPAPAAGRERGPPRHRHAGRGRHGARRRRLRRGAPAHPDREPVRSGESLAARRRPGPRERPPAPRARYGERRCSPPSAGGPLPRRDLGPGGDAGVTGRVRDESACSSWTTRSRRARCCARTSRGDPRRADRRGVRQRLRGGEGRAELAPDLVFLDVQMPKLDGFEVLELLARDRGRLRHRLRQLRAAGLRGARGRLRAEAVRGRPDRVAVERAPGARVARGATSAPGSFAAARPRGRRTSRGSSSGTAAAST